MAGLGGAAAAAADSSESDVWADGATGSGRWVARNVWYVCTEARMKRQQRGSRGRPRRRVRAGVTKACERWGYPKVSCRPPTHKDRGSRDRERGSMVRTFV